MRIKKKQPPKFYALCKDFNSGRVEPYEVLHIVFDNILTQKLTLRKGTFYIFDDKFNRIDVKTKEQCGKFIEQMFRYYFWAKCEWEFVCIDWPYRDTIEQSRPVKVDIYDQLEPNIPVITDIVWDYIKDIIQ